MDVILADVNRLDRLITDISHASRVDAELTGQTPEPEDITALLASWVELSRQRYGTDRLAYTPIKSR